jgi:signal transduction histidine kinase
MKEDAVTSTSTSGWFFSSASPDDRLPDRAAVVLPQPGDDNSRLRRQISHDIHHELGTIMLLASTLSQATDIGPQSRNRARQILGETRWLRQLHRAYEDSIDRDSVAARAERAGDPGNGRGPEPVRLDLLAGEVAAAMQMSTTTRILFSAEEAWAHVDPLAYWRALRNLVGNSVRAAHNGRVEVHVGPVDGWAVVQIDDDGPGFGAVPPGMASLGLSVVQDLAEAWGGELEIRRGVLGGCCVWLRLPASPPAALPTSPPALPAARSVHVAAAPPTDVPDGGE